MIVNLLVRKLRSMLPIMEAMHHWKRFGTFLHSFIIQLFRLSSKDGAKGSCGDLDFFDEELNQPFTYVCREEADGPYAGMMGFDNILYAFFTQFVLGMVKSFYASSVEESFLST